MGTKRMRITHPDQMQAFIRDATALLYRGLQTGPVVLTFGRDGKTRSMEQKYHAMITDIQRHVDPSRDLEVWKTLLVGWFDKELADMGTPLTHAGGVLYDERYQRWVYNRPQTRKFKKQEAKDFIEFLYAFGTEAGVQFSDPVLKYYEEINRCG